MNEEVVVNNSVEETTINLTELEEMMREVAGTTTEESSPLSAEEMAMLEQAVEEAHHEIPTNSGSLLVSESTSRFSSAIWYDKIKGRCVHGLW